MNRHVVCWVVLGFSLSGCGTGPRLEVPTPQASAYDSVEPLAVHAVSMEEIFAVGNMARKDGTVEALVLSSETAGRRWRRHAVEVHDLTNVTLQTVYFSDRVRGWVAGIRVDGAGRTRPVVLRTDDGGNHWRESLLVQDAEVIASEVHSLAFDPDLAEGTIGVTLEDPENGALRETLWSSRDGGRSWTVSAYREPLKLPFRDQSRSMLDTARGYRLRRSEVTGTVILEATASEGRDWMPVYDFSLAAHDTWFGG